MSKNRTHRKAAARALQAAQPGLTYQQALSALDRIPPGGTPAALDPQWRGALPDGYTDDDCARFFAHVAQATGVSLTCVWDYYDNAGYGGDSDWFVRGSDGTLRGLSGDLWAWVNEPADSPDCPATPGDPATWVGPVASFDRAPYNDGWNSYLEDRVDVESMTGECDECGAEYYVWDNEDHCGACGTCYGHGGCRHTYASRMWDIQAESMNDVPDDQVTTTFSYRYVDGANYKAYATVTLRGAITREQVTRIMSALDDGQYFIPGQVNLPHPGTSMTSWPGDDDHVWCSADADDPDAPNDILTAFEVMPDLSGYAPGAAMTVDAFVAGFDAAARDGWDIAGWAGRYGVG